jgi:hypothetical protein
MEEVWGKALELVRGFHQPLQDGVGVDPKDAGHGAEAEPFRQGADGPDQHLWADALAMKERTVGLQKVTAAGDAVQLSPDSPAGMAIGAQIAKPYPALVNTARLRAEV